MKLRERKKRKGEDGEKTQDSPAGSGKRQKQRSASKAQLSKGEGGASLEEIQNFIADIENETMRSDVQELHEMITRLAPELQPTLEFKYTLGYGKYHYKYKSGREGDWHKIGISCGKTISIHCCGLVDGKYVLEKFAKRIGKAKCGKSCVRFNKLEDLDRATLEELIQATASADIMT